MATSVPRMVFVSHANPEDNDFSRWLALQLAKIGYPVWCDLTRLLGGEDFWSDIEQAIRQGTSKFLFVLSGDSNQKPGPLQELALALTVARREILGDFIIPLRIDDIDFQDINIQLNRLNAIDFRAGWASGLRQLVTKLEVDGVPKHPNFSPSSVATWWSGNGRPGSTILHESEEYVSNWFAIESLPEVLYLHSVPQFVTFDDLKSMPFPFRKVGSLVACFSPPDEVNRHLMNGARISESWEVDPLVFLRGVDNEISIDSDETHRILVGLLHRGWWQLSRSAGLRERKVGRSSDFYVPLGLLPRDRAPIPSGAGGSTWRNLVGYRSTGVGNDNERQKRYWHFSVSANVAFQPFPMFQMIPRIVFSADGKYAINNSSRNNRYRRSQARGWWNDEWRDRTLGLVWWLAGQNSQISVPLGPGASAEISSSPVSFQSPVSYQDP